MPLQGKCTGLPHGISEGRVKFEKKRGEKKSLKGTEPVPRKGFSGDQRRETRDLDMGCYHRVSSLETIAGAN